MYDASNPIMEEVFINCDFIAEADYYIWLGETSRDEIEDDVREYLAEFDASEEDVQHYVDCIMRVIEEG